MKNFFFHLSYYNKVCSKPVLLTYLLLGKF